MGCDGCKNKNSAPSSERFDQVFASFWPASLPFPPMVPYLGAVVDRGEAKAWAAAIGASTDPGVLSGDSRALLDMVGRAMMDPRAVFAEARKEKKKKKGDGGPGPGLPGFNCSRTCPDGSGAHVNCGACYECDSGCNPSAYARCVDVCGGSNNADDGLASIKEALSG